MLFTKNNMIIGLTCSKDDMDLFSKSLNSFASTLPDKPAEFIQWNLKPEPKNEAFITASKVQYVYKGYDYHKLGFEWNGKMQVMNKILSSDWLQTQIRVIGGAYGGYSGISRNGVFYFASYRDPNLEETLENYNATPGYIKNFAADSTTMTRYIIGTIAGLDMPLTPSEKGNAACSNYLSKITKQQLQKERNEVLTTTAEDIRGMERLVSGVLDKNVICVYGNEEKIRSDKGLFGGLVMLQK
jgi:Zn-dependent M16 (insulinase) family peptidase